jgi:hypothetical protein
MKFYLKWINPLISIIILVLCTWIYFGDYFCSFNGESHLTKGHFILDPDEMGLSIYFFAKGLFCSSLLFLFGKFLERYLAKK